MMFHDVPWCFMMFFSFFSFLLASSIASPEGSSSLIFLWCFVFLFNVICTVPVILLPLVGTLHLMGTFRLGSLGLPGFRFSCSFSFFSFSFSFSHPVHLYFFIFI